MMLFEVGVRMERTLENGLETSSIVQFAVDALSFTEAEATTTKEVEPFGKLIDIASIKRSRCTECIGAGEQKNWYKAKVHFISINEKTGKEKKTPNYYLVNADTIDEAKQYVDAFFTGSVQDYTIATLDETKIEEVFFNEFRKGISDGTITVSVS